MHGIQHQQLGLTMIAFYLILTLNPVCEYIASHVNVTWPAQTFAALYIFLLHYAHTMKPCALPLHVVTGPSLCAR